MNEPAFHDRPLCMLAAGMLFGTALLRLFAPPYGYAASAVLAGFAVAARWCCRRTLARLLLTMAAALTLALLRYPADGAFAVTGPVLAVEGRIGATLAALRDGIGARISSLFPQTGGVARGMLLGERSGIGKDVLTQFKNAGVMHLLAISGLHVSVLAGAVALLLRGNAWVRFSVVALFLLVYAALTAFSPSIVRAGVMLLSYQLAFPLRRRPDPPSALALALIVILLFNPLALFYTGFQLSFCAVYGLILLSPVLARPFLRLGSAACGVIAGSLAVTVATAPAMAAAFGRIQLMPLLTNLIVLPIVPAFLVPAFCGTAISYLSFPIGQAVCTFAEFVLQCIMTVASVGGRLDVALAAPGAIAYLLYHAALLAVSPLCLLDRYRRLRLASMLMAASVVCWVVG